jgi:hypothetical protein
MPKIPATWLTPTSWRMAASTVAAVGALHLDVVLTQANAGFQTPSLQDSTPDASNPGLHAAAQTAPLL